VFTVYSAAHAVENRDVYRVVAANESNSAPTATPKNVKTGETW